MDNNNDENLVKDKPDYSKMTVDELKELCSTYGVKCKSKKNMISIFR